MEDDTPLFLSSLADEFLITGTAKDVTPFGNGRINRTYLVETESGHRYILQRVNPIFAPTVLSDIKAITGALKRAGQTTTELVPTRTGDLGKECGGALWRVLTYVDGRTIEENISEEAAKNAMQLIGAFHRLFALDRYVFRHVRDGFHDTPRIMETLGKTVEAYEGSRKGAALAGLSRDILSEYSKRTHAWAHLPKRIIHGDPKLNNVRFAVDTDEAVALLDLDTMGRHSVVVDIADAARSWANRADEGDESGASFDLDIFRAMMDGYARGADFLSTEERMAIPNAMLQIALELSARFATDAHTESYFSLDRTRYPDLFTQNFAKARAQFALFRDMVQKRSDIADAAH